MYVFEEYLKLAKKFDKPFILYYGVNGHGNGLVDAMSRFGVKSVLRGAIVTDNFMYNTADELVSFLKETFKDDQHKHYKFLPSDLIEECRKEKGEGIFIKGCKKTRMISLFLNNEWQISRHLCHCKFCMVGEFKMCLKDIDYDTLEDETDMLDETDDVESEMFTFIESNSFVALYSASNSLELFYILKVTEKDVAEDDIIDIYGHIIQEGSNYIKGFYLEKIDEKKGKFYYKQLKKTVYVYPHEVFCPFVALDKDGLFLTALDYQFLADSL